MHFQILNTCMCVHTELGRTVQAYYQFHTEPIVVQLLSIVNISYHFSFPDLRLR